MNKRFKIFSLLLANFFSNLNALWAQEETSSGPSQSLNEVVSQQIGTAKELIEMITEFFVKYSFQVLGGFIVLVLGWIVAKYLSGFVRKFLSKKEVDVTVTKFLVSTVHLLIMAFAVIVALGKFGIEIAPLIAGISVAGFGLSFALQGPLSNYAAGATLVFTKPFKVGEIIEVAGVIGEVIDLKMPRTEIKTIDGHTIVIPNKHIVGEVIHNYSSLKRIDLAVGVSYKADIDKAIQIIQSVIKNEPKIAQDREYKVGITEFADSSVNLMARIRCKQDDYWDVLFTTNKKIFDEFKKQGVEIPFPQRDVHIHKDL